ncbi:MAG: hypothetical protein AB1689_17275, partial [Thermodesulfobacteriota bacterium]
MRALLDHTTEAGAALRTTLAATVAMAVALALHLEVPALAAVFVLARGSAGAVTMLAGAAAGAAAAIALLASFDQSRLAFSLSLFLLTAGAAYASLGRRVPYAFIQFQLSLLVLVGQALDTPDRAVEHAFHDLANVAVAAFAAFVAGASQPVAIPDQLRRTLAAALAQLASLDVGAGDPRAPTAVRLELLARRARVLLAQAWPTRQASRARRRVLAVAVAAVDELHRSLLALAAVGRSLPGTAAGDAERATHALRGCAARLAPLVAPGARAGSAPAALRADA